MAKSFKCAYVGKDCAWSAKEDSTDELMKKIVEHASHEHDIQEIPYELKIKVESSIKDV
ncbi:metal-binding protein [Marine Group I thaumarchaeote SCGC AAA799-E16]|uniref:Metal-binding protein n=4 Tax=Marine Group I TaxID=905826 RepID=A0A087S749_9ARCH|nr:metal-binding protein [Marine Group I thaumarchaeote SCGC AAA799-E16]KFM17347.1 metal-binding protein [Marine Group I thaumarchaeote SCGC AAA799-D11]KFM19367.1 metal-binding protein [Marine Group I thaumarchaeote SCGC RSA3]KFM21553.1 metal-binding protein [Marine Group I thaumarchaeote SCGC AAA799-B03]